MAAYSLVPTALQSLEQLLEPKPTSKQRLLRLCLVFIVVIVLIVMLSTIVVIIVHAIQSPTSSVNRVDNMEVPEPLTEQYFVSKINWFEENLASLRNAFNKFVGKFIVLVVKKPCFPSPQLLEAVVKIIGGN